ncbi:MAG: D-alanyl-D-alanine carboxypeptidase [Leptolyngbyaceae cyanobacterium SL_7_1]|nr:D-alanyl-D-alanine carboxypeptidase [Leptolyngbyaceae cyanobacterium SL_7_1]
MLEFLGSILSIWLDTSEVKTLKSVAWQDWLDTAWIRSLTQPQKAIDPAAVAIVQNHVSAVTATGMATPSQGVWIQTDSEILAEHQGETPLSAASLTKIATTLAALETWEPEHQFETLISASGPIQDGVLQGDLVIQGETDPLFVWEEAIVLANALKQVGIQRVTGELIVTPKFVMNFETDPQMAARLLQQGMNAVLWNEAAAEQYQTLPPTTPRPQLVIEGGVRVLPLSQVAQLSATPLIRHQSVPLVDMLRAMNTYSNNFMSDVIANEIGGAATVAEVAAAQAGIPLEEIQLINGSGLGNENRISPRAVGAMLVAIQRSVALQQLNITDLFPVIGRDRGTLRGRNIAAGAALKTGTLDDVSALAGVIPTRDRGLIWFSIINVGIGDLDFLHKQQDQLLQTLVQTWGSPVVSELRLSDRPTREAAQLGAASRNQILQSQSNAVIKP